MKKPLVVRRVVKSTYWIRMLRSRSSLIVGRRLSWREREREREREKREREREREKREGERERERSALSPLAI